MKASALNTSKRLDKLAMTMSPHRKQFITLYLHFGVSVLLGFIVWTVKYSGTINETAKVVPSKLGITISIINFIFLTVKIISGMDYGNDVVVPTEQVVVAAVMPFHEIYMTFLPLSILVAVWLTSFKYKKMLQEFLRAKKLLEMISSRNDKKKNCSSSRSLVYVIAILGIYLVMIGAKTWYFKRFERAFFNVAPGKDRFNANIFVLLSPIFIFAAIYNLIVPLTYIGEELEAIVIELKREYSSPDAHQ